jgi:hypothetical protein
MPYRVEIGPQAESQLAELDAANRSEVYRDL